MSKIFTGKKNYNITIEKIIDDIDDNTTFSTICRLKLINVENKENEYLIAISRLVNIPNYNNVPFTLCIVYLVTYQFGYKEYIFAERCIRMSKCSDKDIYELNVYDNKLLNETFELTELDYISFKNQIIDIKKNEKQIYY